MKNKHEGFDLKVVFKKHVTYEGEALDGVCIFDGIRSFEIQINEELNLIEKIGVLFHEISHLIRMYYLRQDPDIQKEEAYCEGIEKDAKKWFKRLISK